MRKISSSRPFYILVSLRPRQWIKNLLLFIPLVFSKNVFNLDRLLLSIEGFLVFSLLCGGVYIMNDILDIERDRLHPEKSLRPIPSGKLDLPTARAVSALILLLALAASIHINRGFLGVVVVYLALQVLYSTILKHIVILDVFSIAGSFFLRIIAGAEAISVPVSSWLLICTVFLSLFIALCKRRHEIVLLGEEGGNHRGVLKGYSTLLLDQMVAVTTSASVISYALYTISQETVEKFHTRSLVYTLPFVLYGIYRYLYLVYSRDKGGDPETIFLNDRPMVINIILYIVAVFAILYGL